MSTQSALVAPGTLYATLGTPIGIIRGEVDTRPASDGSHRPRAAVGGGKAVHASTASGRRICSRTVARMVPAGPKSQPWKYMGCIPVRLQKLITRTSSISAHLQHT
eukprot:3772648-Pleurochrysis_carterae.AAC.6